MNKDTLFGIIRATLTLMGAYLAGKNFLGSAVDEVLWQGIAGLVMAVVAMVWGILDKSTNIEAVQSTVRQAITFIGGLLVASGKLTGTKLEAILALSAALLPGIYALLSKEKSRQLAAGEIKVENLKQ